MLQLTTLEDWGEGEGSHLDSHGLTWTHLVSLGLNWTHLESIGLIWIELDSPGLTWPWSHRSHLISLGLTWSHWSHWNHKEKRERPLGRNWAKREKGKAHHIDLAVIPPGLPHRAYARTNETKRFPGWTHSPNLPSYPSPYNNINCCPSVQFPVC